MEGNASITFAAMVQPGDDDGGCSGSQAATVTGYVYDVKAGSEESVNCGATKVADKDTHIEITLSSGDAGPRRRVVVEVTPKWRAYEAQLGENWSTADLRTMFEGKCAEITGWLFWDTGPAVTNPRGLEAKAENHAWFLAKEARTYIGGAQSVHEVPELAALSTTLAAALVACAKLLDRLRCL